MNFRDYLQVLRRRLPVVVIALVVGLAGGWFWPSAKAGRDTMFRATHTLIYEGRGAGKAFNLEQVALLATSGAVPSRVAGRLNIDRATVRSAVSAVADTKLGTIAISAKNSNAEQAVLLAGASAEELLVEIGGNDQAAFDAEVDRLTTVVDGARANLGRARGAAAQAAAQGEVAKAEQALQQYQTQKPKTVLRTLEHATAAAVAPEGVKAPESRPARALLLGVVGLLLGFAAVFGLDRLDTRIRSKNSAERAFGAPVVTEVPVLPKAAQGQLLTRTQPTGSFMEAYRGLRTYVALWGPEKGPDDGHRVIVVTSPSAGEGKTTSVSHLAAMLAEIGRSVLVVSADLRRPRIHEYFGRPGYPGLVDILSGAPDAPSFEDLDLSTSVRGVRLIPSGPATENPAPLLEHAGDLLRAARGLADFVLVDTPPLLVANDAVDLARHADGVLLVARAGATPVEAAQRSAEQLARLDIPVVGVVLVASESASTKSRYYSSRYYSEPERKGGRRTSSGNDGQLPSAEESTAPEEQSPVVSGT